MNDCIIRRGCEAAGLEEEPDQDGRPRWVMPDDEWVLPPDHPALPSYVADLLVEKVRELSKEVQWRYFLNIDTGTGKERSVALATPMQRIEACLEVLHE